MLAIGDGSASFHRLKCNVKGILQQTKTCMLISHNLYMAIIHFHFQLRVHMLQVHGETKRHYLSSNLLFNQ